MEITVNYLLGLIFSTQTSCEKSTFRATLLQTVLFVDDRIRAVQVDLTTLMAHQNNNDNEQNMSRIRKLQLKVIRYHLLSQHLLSNLSPRQYEWKFGHKALTTAITAFYATYETHQDSIDSEDGAMLDEVMGYSTLLHLASVVYARESSIQSYNCTSSNQKWCGLSCDDGHGMSAVLQFYRKYCPSNKHLSFFPKYEWALKVGRDFENGNYLSVIRLLTTSAERVDHAESVSWKILARCCLAQVMPSLRIGLLRYYNKSFMKEEKVQDDDVSTQDYLSLLKLTHQLMILFVVFMKLGSLVSLPDSKSVIKFCKNIGLPTSTNFVIMKAAPICIQDDNHDKDEIIRQITNPGRDEDNFVFGSLLKKWILNDDTDSKKERNIAYNESQKMSSLQRALAKVKIDDQNQQEVERKGFENDEAHNKWQLTEFDNLLARTDYDGVLIFPSAIFRQLIFA